MREVLVILWCDKHWADIKAKVEATERVTVAVDGQGADLDLCASHAAEVRGTGKAWQKIGRPAAAKPKRGHHRPRELSRRGRLENSQRPRQLRPDRALVRRVGSRPRPVGSGPLGRRSPGRQQRDRAGAGVKPATPRPELHDCRSNPKGWGRPVTSRPGGTRVTCEHCAQTILSAVERLAADIDERVLPMLRTLNRKVEDMSDQPTAPPRTPSSVPT